MQYLKEVTSKEFIPGFFGKFIHGSQTTLAFIDIKKGSELKEHHHINEQITHIVEGEFEMNIGGKRYRMTSGCVNVIPPNVPHSAIALTDCKVIDAFSPARDDYRFS